MQLRNPLFPFSWPSLPRHSPLHLKFMSECNFLSHHNSISFYCEFHSLIPHSYRFPPRYNSDLFKLTEYVSNPHSIHLLKAKRRSTSRVHCCRLIYLLVPVRHLFTIPLFIGCNHSLFTPFASTLRSIGI